MTKDLNAGFTKFSSPDRITCVAFHPSEELFATGDVIGVIRMWYGLTPARLKQTSSTREGRAGETSAPTTTLHWHAHAVKSITFSPNGAYLLSGGEEAVLVVWQLQTGHKEFIPRIGAPINSIVVAPTHSDREQEVLVALLDGTIVIITVATLKIARIFKEIKSCMLCFQLNDTLTF